MFHVKQWTALLTYFSGVFVSPGDKTRLACVLALGLAGCAGGGGDEAATRPTSFDGEVLRIAVERADGGAETFSSLRDEWYSWSWFPFMPNHSGRRWTMGKTDRDGVSLAYALVSWDNDDPTDYLSAGFWMRFDGARNTRRLDPADATIIPFVDGPELDPAARLQLPVSGTASYAGGAGGVWRHAPPGEAPLAEEFSAVMTLRADFAAGTIAGCIGCIGDIALEREHLYAILGWRRGRGEAEPAHTPAGYEIRFAPAPLDRTGGFAGEAVSVTHSERGIARSDGAWSGRLSSRLAADGAPRLAAGHASARYAEAGGGAGSFDSIFTAIHPELQPAPPAP